MYIKCIEKYDKKRFKVICDDAIFLLYLGDIRNYSLKEDMTLDDELLKDIYENVLYKRARERALHLIERSDKTEYQIINKLKEGFYPEEIQKKVVSFLKKYNYIDDYSYCRRYIEANIKRKSIIIIKKDLYLKGIKKDIVDSCLDELEGEEDIQLQNIKSFLDKKNYLEKKNDQKEKKKIFDSLIRKGYPYELILSVIENYS